jgi:hypothetical protein
LAIQRSDRCQRREFQKRHAREIIRLKFSAYVSAREVARRLDIARSTVRETLKRFESAGLIWPLPDHMSDGALEASLYANRRSKRGHRRCAEPDWPSIHHELKRKHVTLLIFWDEYSAANPGGYSYSRFCQLYRAFKSKLAPTMRQTHAAGERLFVDYAGDGVPVVIDRLTGEIRMAQIFAAVLGASSFTFAWASLDADAPRLDLALARGDGRHPRILRSLGRTDLLILDDWGLEPLDAAARHDLLEILEERYGRRSTIVTSQIPLNRWHEIIGDPTYANAILDRLVHNAHRIELAGEGMRRTRGKANQKA